MQSLIEERFIKVNYSKTTKATGQTHHVKVNDTIIQLDSVMIKRYNKNFKKRLETSSRKYVNASYMPNNEETKKKKLIQKLKKKIEDKQVKIDNDY